MREKERMERDVSNFQLLSVDQLMSNGTVFENRTQFEQSIFSDVYKRAGELINQIIKDNCSWRKNKKQEFKSSNVLSFIGRRGTGKTSAMCSFAQILKESEKNIYAQNAQLEYENWNSNVGFHVLERIDASTLEASEDMFLLILASMFTKLLNREEQKSGIIQGYENRVLFDKFERIFEDFKALDEHADTSGYSIFEQLKNMASSQRIRENFKSLVDLYLNEMMENDGNQSDAYLVVMIDDLDMAKQKREQRSWNWGSYKIMSSIYKYLTVPRVIVLTAYNAENLYSQCINYYKVQYESGLARYESLASQFMEKVFPIYTRLYMPSWKKVDLDTKGKIRIGINEYEDSRMHQVQQRKNGHLTIREFIMVLLAEKTGIYFNLFGEKPHYLEPDTLRTLFNVTVLLHGLRPYNAGEKRGEADFKNLLFNLDILKKDCLFRFASDQLSDTTPKIVEGKTANSENYKLSGGVEYEIFHEWQGMPIVLRSEKIVELIGRNITTLDQLEKGGRKMGMWRSLRIPYSYAELIHCIYAMENKTAELSPEFGNCILYSYTLYMTELYEKYLYYKRLIKKDEFIFFNRTITKGRRGDLDESIEISMAKQYYKELKGIMGSGICGRWTQYYFPQVRYSLVKEIREKKYRIGYVEAVRWEFLIELDPFATTDNMMFVDCIKAFLFVVMMHTNVMKWNQDDFKCSWIETKEKTKLQLAFVEKQAAYDFDMTMPIFYTFCYAEFLDKMEDEIQECVSRFVKKEGNKDGWNRSDGSIQMTIRQAFNQIWAEYYQWDQKYGNMMLPVYNVDVMYNMMASVYEECIEMAPLDVALDRDDTPFFSEYRKMLERFCYYLEKNNECFGLDKIEGYVTTFISSPIYRMVEEWNGIKESQYNDERSKGVAVLKRKIANYAMRMVQYFATEEEAEQAPD